jgi:hypothetical protein
MKLQASENEREERDFTIHKTIIRSQISADFIHPFTNNSQQRFSKGTKERNLLPQMLLCRKEGKRRYKHAGPFTSKSELSDYGTAYLSTPPLQTLCCVQKKAQQITELTHQSKTLLLHCFSYLLHSSKPYLSRRGNATERLTRTAKLEANRPLMCHVLEHAVRCTQGCPKQHRGLLHLTTQRTLSIFNKNSWENSTTAWPHISALEIGEVAQRILI